MNYHTAEREHKENFSICSGFHPGPVLSLAIIMQGM
jgi:hypothetical protein